MMTYLIETNVNGRPRVAEVTARDTLLDVLRDHWDVFEVKNGCEQGDCGVCTVILSGKAVNACLTLAVQANGKDVVTVKGIGSPKEPHLLQTKFVEHGAIQCGFCTPGMLTSAKVLLDQNPKANRQEIREAIAGNLCRCTGYKKIVDAIEAAAAKPES